MSAFSYHFQTSPLRQPGSISPAADYLRRVHAGETLTSCEAAHVVETLLDPATTDAQAGALLAALAQRGETAQEVTGFVQAMRTRMQSAPGDIANAIDTAGTGGSPKRAFNVSTAAAIVAASIGIPVAKHGGRGNSSGSGSGEVLKALGVNIECSRETSIACVREAGIGFFFGPVYHPAMARIAPIRKQLGIRTTFNLAAPLSNPLGVKRQLLGVATSTALLVVAESAAALGTHCTWVVHGEDGLDEISISAPTAVVEIQGSAKRCFSLSPEDFGRKRQSLCLERGTPERNAELLHKLLDGGGPPEVKDLIICNAAAAAAVSSGDRDLRSLASRCEEALRVGSALKTLERLIQISNRTDR